MSNAHRVHVWDGWRRHRLRVADGANLRRALLGRGISPYTAITRHLNCGGRGLCATCGVRFFGHAPPPMHWHDRLAARFGYPRLSCQIRVKRDLGVRLLPQKRIWGRRRP
jgi:ferredoxin